MLARLMSFWVWLLLGGSVAYWGLQLLARPLPMPTSVLPAGEGQAGPVDLSRLLGTTVVETAPEPEAAPSTRLRLLGVVAPKNARAAEAGEGVALIEVDGVARTVRVGAVVDGELRLLRVNARSAGLGRAGQAPTQVLQISPPAAPSTGSLAAAMPSPVVLGGNPPGTTAQMPPPPPVITQQPAYGLPLAGSGNAPGQPR
jgi:general secretion pathway protein C